MDTTTLSELWTSPYTLTVALMFLSYLLGSIPLALVISRILQFNDPRESGSGNAGATNMMRLHGWKPALITLLGDIGKGTLCVYFASRLFINEELNNNISYSSFNTDLAISLIAGAVIIGHVYPIFFRFKGGKGVATMLGTMLAASPLLALCIFSLWIGLFAVTRVSAKAALGCAVVTPLLAWLLEQSNMHIWLTCSVLLFYTHRDNLRSFISSSN